MNTINKKRIENYEAIQNQCQTIECNAAVQLKSLLRLMQDLKEYPHKLEPTNAYEKPKWLKDHELDRDEKIKVYIDSLVSALLTLNSMNASFGVSSWHYSELLEQLKAGLPLEKCGGYTEWRIDSEAEDKQGGAQ